MTTEKLFKILLTGIVLFLGVFTAWTSLTADFSPAPLPQLHDWMKSIMAIAIVAATIATLVRIWIADMPSNTKKETLDQPTD